MSSVVIETNQTIVEIPLPGESSVASAAIRAAERAETYASTAAEDAIATAADRVQTGLDRIQTGQDRQAVAADKASADADAIATAADRMQTGLDRASASNSAAATAADRVQTGLDRIAAASSASAAAGSASAAAATVPVLADRTVGRRPSDTSIWSMVRATTAWGIDATGALVETAVDTIRWEYDPATLAPLGPAFAGAGSNRLLNPRFGGGTPGVIGSGGALPTNVTTPGADAGITLTYNGNGVENGYPYAEFTLVGTPVGTTYVFACATGSETWVTGEPLAVQGGLRLSGGSLAGISTSLLRLINLTPAFASSSITLTSAMRTIKAVFTPTAGATNSVLLQYRISMFTGTPINATIRLYAPMVARRAFCESLVLPAVGGTGVSTRAQGTVSLPITQFGTRFQRRQGILIVDWNSQPGPFTSALDADWFGLASWGDTTANERLGILINPAHTTVEARVFAGGIAGTSSSVTISAPAAGTTTIAAVSWNLDAGFLQVASRGVAGSKVALTALPVQGFLMPGRFGTTHPLFGCISGFEVRPAALFDSSLASLTA